MAGEAPAAGPTGVFTDLRIVRQEHLNQYGCLFGGFLLLAIDELAFIAAMKTFPGRHFLTRALERVEFHTPAQLGDILEFSATVERVGRTSVQVRVQVFVSHAAPNERTLTFDGLVVLVCVDRQGRAQPVRSTPPSA